MTERSTFAGVIEVLKAGGVVFATVFFLPGVLVRMACQLVAASASGTPVVHRNLLTEMGGEPVGVSGTPDWNALLLATVIGPVAIGSVLLFPSVVRFELLGVNPFLSVNPGIIFSHQNSVAPFLETAERFGFVGFLRLWFGVSCFYCSVPSEAILRGIKDQDTPHARISPLRLFLKPLLLVFNLMGALDRALLVFFPGVYLASGLLMLLLGWFLLALLANVALGG